MVPQPAGGAIDLASDPAGDDDGTAFGWGVFKMQYMGTWSHMDAADKKAPESMSKHDFGELVTTKAGNTKQQLRQQGQHALRRMHLFFFSVVVFFSKAVIQNSFRMQH